MRQDGLIVEVVYRRPRLVEEPGLSICQGLSVNLKVVALFEGDEPREASPNHQLINQMGYHGSPRYVPGPNIS